MGNILSDITESFKGAFASFGKKPEVVLGIDIGSSAIKLVQLKKENGKVVLETYGAVALGPYVNEKAGQMPNLSTEDLVKALADVLKEAHTTTTDAGLSIQSGASLIFVLDLPKVNESEYKNIVPNEARKYIPVPLTEVSLDWWIIPENEYEGESSNRTQVLVVAVRNETLSQYRDIVTQSKLTSSFFELEVFSIIRSSFHHELDPVIAIDIGARSVRVAVIEYGVVRVFHTVNRGSQQITQTLATALGVPFEKAEEIKKSHGLHPNEKYPDAAQVINTSVAYMFSEINSVLLNYEKEYNRPVGQMYLSGGGARMPGLLAAFQNEFKFDVTVVDPFAKTVYPEFLANILHESGPEFAIAVGLALKQLSSQ